MQHPKYGSLSDARGYAAEISHHIAHPEEEGFDELVIAALKQELREIRAFLAEGDEGL